MKRLCCDGLGRRRLIATLTLIALVALILLSAVPRSLEAESDKLPSAIITGVDRAPLYIKVRVKGLFRSMDDVKSYISARKEVLKSLASEGVTIKAKVSFLDLSVEELAPLLRTYGIDRIYGVQLRGVDGEGNYLFTCGMGKGRVVSVEALDSELRKLLELSPIKAPRVEVNYVWLEIPPNIALNLDKDPKVLLVDPINDVEGLLRWRALFIEVYEMPHISYYYRLYSLGGAS